MDESNNVSELHSVFTLSNKDDIKVLWKSPWLLLVVRMAVNPHTGVSWITSGSCNENRYGCCSREMSEWEESILRGGGIHCGIFHYSYLP